MKRTSLAIALAVPLVFAWPHGATANPPKQCSFGYGGCGFCLSFFPGLHQHGPLFNYGPYYGYPPFEPYGPWNAYLQYNPWYWGVPGGGAGGWGHSTGRTNCGSGCGLFQGWHAAWRDGGWFRGIGCWGCNGGLGLRERFNLVDGSCKSCRSASPVSTGCSSCKAAALDPETTDPLSRYSGSGVAAASAVFYAELPTLDPTAAVRTAGGGK
jgi:hypothetical protein